MNHMLIILILCISSLGFKSDNNPDEVSLRVEQRSEDLKIFDFEGLQKYLNSKDKNKTYVINFWATLKSLNNKNAHPLELPSSIFRLIKISSISPNLEKYFSMTVSPDFLFKPPRNTFLLISSFFYLATSDLFINFLTLN